MKSPRDPLAFVEPAVEFPAAIELELNRCYRRDALVDRMEAHAQRAAVVPLTREHVEYLKPLVRIFDEQCVREHYGLGGAEMLEAGLVNSAIAWAGLVDGVPICAFGLIPAGFISAIAEPWLIATPDIARFKRIFWTHSREVVALMLEEYPVLVARCQANFDASRKWLARLGFREVQGCHFRVVHQEINPKPAGPGLDFVTLKLERNC